MGKGDYKKMVCESSYFKRFEEILCRPLNSTEKEAFLKMTFRQIEIIGIMLSSAKDRDWHRVMASSQRNS